jgi:GNAT superfamily N-acetyltransferase
LGTVPEKEDAMSAETNLYYIQVPREVRRVAHRVEFLSIDEFLRDEEACRTLWDLVGSQFRTRSKFLAVWPHVRFVGVHRDERGIGGMLLVATPINWQIDYVVVAEDRRGQGIATSLVNETVNQALARQVPYVMLTSRERLRPLYAGQCGFVPVSSSADREATGTNGAFALADGNGH